MYFLQNFSFSVARKRIFMHAAATIHGEKSILARTQKIEKQKMRKFLRMKGLNAQP